MGTLFDLSPSLDLKHKTNPIMSVILSFIQTKFRCNVSIELERNGG